MQIWVTIKSCEKIRRKPKVLQVYDYHTVSDTAPKTQVKMTVDGQKIKGNFENLSNLTLTEVGLERK